MAYSTYQKHEEEIANDEKFWKEFDAIAGEKSLGHFLAIAKALAVSGSAVGYWAIKKRIGDFIYGKPVEPPESVGFVHGLNTKFPDNSRLEEMCEQIAIQVEKEEKNVNVAFAGLMYHLYLNLGKDEFHTPIMERDGKQALIDPEYYATNHCERYSVTDGILFVPVKLHDSKQTITSSEALIPFKGDYKIHPDSYIGGFMEFDVYGRKPGTMQVFVSPGGKKVYNPKSFMFENLVKLPDKDSTQIAFIMSPHLEALKEKIIMGFSK